MAFSAIAMEPDAFEAWLEARKNPSGGSDAYKNGRMIFDREGCTKCHAVDGEGQARAGPDLSHIGSRETIGAGLLKNTPENLARFIADSASLKPGSQMPAYPHLREADLTMLAGWLKGLE